MEKCNFQDLIKALIETFKEDTLDELLKYPQYCEAIKNEELMEIKYNQLNLDSDIQLVVNEFLIAKDNTYSIYSYLNYLAGLQDAVKILSLLGLLDF